MNSTAMLLPVALALPDRHVAALLYSIRQDANAGASGAGARSRIGRCVAGCWRSAAGNAGSFLPRNAGTGRARCHAPWSRGDTLDGRRGLRLYVSAWRAKYRKLRRVVVDGDGRQLRCLHGRRHGELLFVSRDGQHRRLWPHHAQHDIGLAASRRGLRGLCFGGRSLRADGSCIAGGRNTSKQSSDP